MLGLTISVCVTLALGAVWLDNGDDERRFQQFGDSLALGLANLAVEPLTQLDRLTLGVLANRLLELPEVSGVSVYTLDNEMFILNGDVQRGRAFSQPIVRNRSIIGYVRLYLVAAPQAADSTTPLLGLSLLIAIVVPLLVVGLSELRLPRTPGRQPRVTVDESAFGHESDEITVPHYLLVLNLFNQLSLKAPEREQELAHAGLLADEVAGIYYARVSKLTGRGLILEFDHTVEEDRPLQVICAAFVLERLLHDSESWGRYRLGLHLIELPRSTSPAADAPEVTDAALLSALAKDSTLAVSAEFYRRVSSPEALESQRMSNPLLQELESTPADAWLISGLDSAHQAQVAQQVREIQDAAIAYPADSTSKASTF
jgi:uncharacterized membrane protein affecting hemolysin expression